MKLTLQVVCFILIWKCVLTRLTMLVLDRVCVRPAETGPCNATLERYYYNDSVGKCMKFIYGGCEGNGNNFKTEENCKKVCKLKPGEPGVFYTTRVDVCSLPKQPGPCEAAIERYYHNTTTKTCQMFIYGGCQGNVNNFETLEKCVERCSESTVLN